jgi:hypothetical protein
MEGQAEKTELDEKMKLILLRKCCEIFVQLAKIMKPDSSDPVIQGFIRTVALNIDNETNEPIRDLLITTVASLIERLPEAEIIAIGCQMTLQMVQKPPNPHSTKILQTFIRKTKGDDLRSVIEVLASTGSDQHLKSIITACFESKSTTLKIEATAYTFQSVMDAL